MQKRIQIGFYIIIGIFLIILSRLWYLQVLEGNKYKAMSEGNRLKIIRTPAPRGIIYDRNRTPLVKNVPSFSVSIDPYNLKDIDIKALSALVGMEIEEIADRLNKNKHRFVPVRLKQGLTFEDVARIEARRSDFPGLFIETEVGREYPFVKVGAHIIGYLGKITTAQQNMPELRHFPPDALIGQWGVEALFDDYLRGISGERIIETDAIGRELRILQEKRPVKGRDIELTIDIYTQKAVEDAFRDKAGALVAIKPDSGEILALESLPSFDPNSFSNGINHKEWKAIIEDKKRPMLNRAIQSQYPPGSVFKIITAIAALEEGVIEADAKIKCAGGINYGKWRFGCWRKEGHGYVDFHKAIVESCDTYFYELGKRLGIERIYKYATAFGFGKKTGIELMPVKERSGLVPNAEWKSGKKKQPWYLGDTFNSAIGQGYIAATPIQIALMMAALSNGGTIFKPSLIKGEAIETGKVKLKPETMKLINDALRGVVNEPNGTARGAKSLITTISGKTGTAQTVGKKRGVFGAQFADHAWFAAFAPYQSPEIALSVFVEHGGSGGGVAAPIAKRAVEAYMKGKEKQVKR